MEEWRSIESYPQYQVSSLGKVKSFKYDKVNGKIMTINFDSHGYGFIKIFNEDGRKKFRIARLVAMTFIPNPDNLSTVDHINRNKTDNRVENLRWASHELQQENRDTAKGERSGVSVLTEEQVLKIKALRKQGLGYRKIARLLDCTNSHVITAINNWKHLD